MQHLPMLEAARRAFRSRICPVCPQRPHGSEKLPPTEPRSCEPQCSIFLNEEKLRDIAHASPIERHPDLELAIRNEICMCCTLDPSSGDFCGERLNRTCPLSVFGAQAIGILEGLVVAEEFAKRHAAAAVAGGADIPVCH